jgi:membrane fusion protein, heavy metal efflux system
VGHAFKQEAPFLERAAQERRPITIEFAEDDGAHWPLLDQTFEIRHLANAIDSESRTFDFFIPLSNQSRSYEKHGETFMVWRFRPGQRARLHVPVEELKDVFVLPAAAIVREGPEAYVFRQNGDLFDRRPVHVYHEDRRLAVIANDGSVTPGMYLAQGAAASLNRVLKAQAASGEQPGVHVHPDGTVHAAH